MSEWTDNRLLNDCGCCEGTHQATPQVVRNRHGLNEIGYRIGTYADFRDSLVAQLSDARYPALQDLRTRDTDDYTIALLDAFSVTADVFTFYQERLANESFLRTANERLSINEMARLLGYRLSPGVSASADLVFTVDEPVVATSPEAQPIASTDPQPVIIEAGTKVQSIPGQDESPQLFETVETVAATADWNIIKPLQWVDQNLPVGSFSLVLQGVAPQLAPGDVLLLKTATKTAICHLSNVDVDTINGWTTVTWSPALTQAFMASDPFEVFAMREVAAIFGHNAVEWRSLPDQTKADYLNINVDDLKPHHQIEWPGFTIYSPGDPLVFQPESLSADKTLKNILDTVIETSDQLAKTASKTALQALPSAAMETTMTVGQLISNIVGVLTTTDLVSEIEASTEQIETAIDTLLRGLFPNANISLATDFSVDGVSDSDDANFITALFGNDGVLAEQSNTLAQSINDLISLGTEFGENVQGVAIALSPVSLLNEIFNQFSSLLAPLGGSATDLVSILDTARDRITAGAVHAAMAEMVKSVAHVAVETGFVTSPFELVNLVKYTTRISSAALSFSPGSILATAVADFMVELDNGANNAMEGKATFDDLINIGTSGAVAAAAGAVIGPLAIDPYLGPLFLIDLATAGSADVAAEQFHQAMESTLDWAVLPTDVPQPAYHAGFVALESRIDLDRVYKEITEDSWAILAKPGFERAFQINSVTSVTRAQFLISGKVSRLSLSGAGLDSFANNLRQTTVYVVSELLQPELVPLAADIEGQSIILDRLVEDLPLEKKVVVSGITSDTLSDHSETLYIKETDTLVSPLWPSGGALTKLTFESPLRNSYQRNGVRVFGNVACANHGETTIEVLGSGDATRRYQNFTLKQSPLTYVTADTPAGTQPTLEIFVNDLRWEEVPFLYQQGPQARVFTTYRDVENNIVVQFGDGRDGALLPTGENNARAVYRKGIGNEGMVRKAQLSQLMTRPLGLKDAINPAAAEGAADPESTDDARENAPLTVLTLDRAVSLQDYEDYARAFAGIAKAQASWFWDGRRRVIIITVAGSNGSALVVEGPTITNLIGSLRQSGDPYVPFHVINHRQSRFRMGARLLVAPEYIQEKVFDDAKQRLRDHFSFANRQFTQPVVLSEVVHVLQKTAGVVAADLDLLYRDDAPEEPQLNHRLIADHAVLSADIQPIAAELLLLHDDPLDYLDAIL